MIADWTGQKESMLPIIHNHYNFQKKCTFIWENMSGRDIAKHFSTYMTFIYS